VRASRGAARAGTRPSPGRTALRVTGVAIAAVVALGGTPAVAQAAPSDNQIAAAQAAADAVATRIDELSGQLHAAQASVDGARAASVIALDEYQATQAAYQVAEEEATAAADAAEQATADLGVARDQVIAFARRSYMQGSTYTGAAALITAADPGELIQRAALLEAAGSHRSDVLDHVAVLQKRATEAEAVARAGVETAAGLREHAAAALATAQAAEVSAREQAAALGTQQARLTSELATAQAELQALVGERAAAERTAQVTRSVPAPRPTRVAPAPSGNDTVAGAGKASAARTAIEAGLAYRGTPYAWGGGGTRGPGPGQDPDLGVIGFDCSGLTQYAYARAGISIPRNSRAQYSSLPKVASSDLRPGDLVFWATDASDPNTIRHVAIYLGDDRVVQAPQSGDVVKVSGMWWQGYAGAVRPSA
jgi:cell wall-associated NlpC family hydrolase